MRTFESLSRDWTLPPGETLREALLERGISQKEFAKQMGMKPTAISALVNGKRQFSVMMAMRLEDVLGISAVFWLKLEINHRRDLEQGRKVFP